MTEPRDQRSLLQKVAGRLASSFLLTRGRRLYYENEKNWLLPMSKADKLWAGSFIILRDYADGRFPPRSSTAETTHKAEIDYSESLPNVSLSEHRLGQLRKPFWDPQAFEKYSRNFTRLWRLLRQLGLEPGSRLLELGCGNGWMAEFLAMCGYSVVGTSIAPDGIEIAERRRQAIEVKGFGELLSYRVSPMESVEEAVTDATPFDGVFVFEALHHAYDWRQAIRSSYSCLKEGGWLILANEPNVLHTFISYRVGRISNTHEIGLHKGELLSHLTTCGFSETRVLQPKWDNRVTEHWIAARK